MIQYNPYNQQYVSGLCELGFSVLDEEALLDKRITRIHDKQFLKHKNLTLKM